MFAYSIIQQVPEGYRVTYVPAAPGDYLITIKFVGVNIAGSPFKCRVSGANLSRGYASSCREHSNIVFETVEKTAHSSHLASMQKSMHSDASRVKVKGNGLSKAFRNQKAQFVVDTREAGELKTSENFLIQRCSQWRFLTQNQKILSQKKFPKKGSIFFFIIS